MAQVPEQAAGTPAWVWREGWPEMPLFFTFFFCGLWPQTPGNYKQVPGSVITEEFGRVQRRMCYWEQILFFPTFSCLTSWLRDLTFYCFSRLDSLIQRAADRPCVSSCTSTGIQHERDGLSACPQGTGPGVDHCISTYSQLCILFHRPGLQNPAWNSHPDFLQINHQDSFDLFNHIPGRVMHQCIIFSRHFLGAAWF